MRRDALVRAVYRAGWAGAGRLPAGVTRALSGPVGRWVVRADRTPVRTLRDNLERATGAPVPDALLRAAVRSYVRTFHEVLALPHWAPGRAVASVSVPDVERLRAAYERQGVVVALPHSGNWDLAGAWACGSGFPVTTVAEQLPAAEYAAFLAFRERLGMEVLSHRDPTALTGLVRAVERGRVICLIADRDLSATGVQVRWRDEPVRLPAGPALVARRSGAALIPGVCRYTGPGMMIALGPVVEPEPGRSGLAAMTQRVADFFAAEIARQPEDWHMFQPFFRSAAAAAA